MFAELNPDYVESAQGSHGYSFCLASFPKSGKKLITSTKLCIKKWNAAQTLRGAKHLVMNVQDINGEP